MNVRVNLNLFVLLLMSLAALSACGIKPGKVAAPQGEDKDEFEHIYPDPATFPHAGSQ